jgi:hypothetical protein
LKEEEEKKKKRTLKMMKIMILNKTVIMIWYDDINLHNIHRLFYFPNFSNHVESKLFGTRCVTESLGYWTLFSVRNSEWTESPTLRTLYPSPKNCHLLGCYTVYLL